MAKGLSGHTQVLVFTRRWSPMWVENPVRECRTSRDLLLEANYFHDNDVEPSQALCDIKVYFFFVPQFVVLWGAEKDGSFLRTLPRHAFAHGAHRAVEVANRTRAAVGSVNPWEKPPQVMPKNSPSQRWRTKGAMVAVVHRSRHHDDTE